MSLPNAALDATTARAVLGVAAGASTESLKRAWRALALRHHPDKNPDDPEAACRFREAAEAYQVLTRGEAPHCKSYDELAKDHSAAHEALQRAMDLAARAALPKADTGANATEKVMKVGGATWVGEVDAGRPHGSGDLILPNGSVHHGAFRAGRASGPGVFYDAAGTVTEGSWTDNKRTGAFTTIDPKGTERRRVVVG